MGCMVRFLDLLLHCEVFCLFVMGHCMISYPCAVYEDKLISPFLSLSDTRGATGYLRTRLKSSHWQVKHIGRRRAEAISDDT